MQGNQDNQDVKELLSEINETKKKELLEENETLKKQIVLLVQENDGYKKSLEQYASQLRSDDDEEPLSPREDTTFAHEVSCISERLTSLKLHHEEQSKLCQALRTENMHLRRCCDGNDNTSQVIALTRRLEACHKIINKLRTQKSNFHSSSDYTESPSTSRVTAPSADEDHNHPIQSTSDERSTPTPAPAEVEALSRECAELREQITQRENAMAHWESQCRELQHKNEHLEQQVAELNEVKDMMTFTQMQLKTFEDDFEEERNEKKNYEKQNMELLAELERCKGLFRGGSSAAPSHHHQPQRLNSQVEQIRPAYQSQQSSAPPPSRGQRHPSQDHVRYQHQHSEPTGNSSTSGRLNIGFRTSGQSRSCEEPSRPTAHTHGTLHYQHSVPPNQVRSRNGGSSPQPPPPPHHPHQTNPEGGGMFHPNHQRNHSNSNNSRYQNGGIVGPPLHQHHPGYQQQAYRGPPRCPNPYHQVEPDEDPNFQPGATEVPPRPNTKDSSSS